MTSSFTLHRAVGELFIIKWFNLAKLSKDFEKFHRLRRHICMKGGGYFTDHSLNFSVFWTKHEPQKHISVQLNGPLASEMFGFLLPFSVSVFLGFHNKLLFWSFKAACCASRYNSVSLREDPKITKGFIYLFYLFSPSPSMLLCFPQTDKRIRANWTWPTDSCLK